MSDQNVTAFLKRLSEFDRSKTRIEVFRAFCEMAFCAIAKTTATTRERADQLESDYMACVARFRNKEDVRAMPELLAIAASALAQGGRDFFGAVAAEIGALDAKLGQFFTPYEVSRLMAEMSLGDAAAAIRDKGFLTIQEPAAGAGGMILAAADAIEGQGFDPAATIWFEAIELNRPTFQMAYLQTALRGLAGKVVCGNALSREVYEVAFTPAALLFLQRHGDPFADQKARAAQEDAQRIEEEAAQDAARAKRLSSVRFVRI